MEENIIWQNVNKMGVECEKPIKCGNTSSEP